MKTIGRCVPIRSEAPRREAVLTPPSVSAQKLGRSCWLESTARRPNRAVEIARAGYPFLVASSSS